MKPRKPATAAAAAVTGGEAAESSLSSVSSMDELPWSVKRNNFLLASALFTFCVSVAWYSMNAVGQADNRSTSNNINDNSSDTAHDTDDPLAALRVEAQAAQDARGKQLEEAKEASAMLQQFDKGAFDPDRIDEEEEELLAEEEAAEEEKKKKNGKSSWWRWLKFW